MATREDSPPLTLSADTLALLREFNDERAAHQRRFDELETAAERQRISLATWSELFKEDWQLSQFWYSNECAVRIAHFLEASLPTPRPSDRRTRVAFLCSPTAFVAFTQEFGDREDLEALLLEHDDRFAKLDDGERARYIRYDLHKPDAVPVELSSSIDLAIADPPFLNAETNRDVAQTLRRILRPDGRFVLLTSVSMTEALPAIYDSPPIGPLHQARDLHIEHAGDRLSNAFGAWTSLPRAVH